MAFAIRAPGLMRDNLSMMTNMPSVQASADVGGETPGKRGKKEDRIPQWGYHETKEFIAIRAELEKDFTQTKRNKTLWELIAGKMKEKGFRRSADQCKCKWKNLVNRYKVLTSLFSLYLARFTTAGLRCLLSRTIVTQPVVFCSAELTTGPDSSSFEYINP